MRDQNPLLRGFYLPAPRLAPEAGSSVALALAWSNTVNLPSSANEQLYVDEETAEVDLRGYYRAGDWLASIELPLVWRGGGILDGIIDDWHGLLGVNRGDRPRVQSNAYRITYTANGEPPIDVARGPALGDVPIEVGRRLLGGPGSELCAWAGLKLPTGSRDHSTGSGAFDAAAWLSGGHALGARTDLYAQAGLMRIGGDGGFARISRWTEFGTLGISARVTGGFAAIAQFDAHSALPASELDLLRPALVLSVGGRFRVGSSLALDVGVQEDAATNHSPDATFYLALRQSSSPR